MTPVLTVLGSLPALARPATWVLTQLMVQARPAVGRFLQDPAGAVSRLGDVIVWQGEQGREVIATLEHLAESQDRVTQAVERIEEAQIGVAGALGTLTS